MLSKRKVVKEKESMFAGVKFTDWASLAITFVGVLVALAVLYQNTITINLASDTFRLSLAPELELQYPSESQRDNISIRSASAGILTDFKIFPICYLVSTNESREIIQRHQSTAIDSVKKLSKDDFLDVPAADVIDRCPIAETTDTSANRIYVLVISFYREVDRKRFVNVEIFSGGVSNGSPTAIPIYADGRASTGGNPSGIVRTLQKIEETERTFFRTKEE